ncbi:hypothetical protein HYR99_41675 [Candidatus Poribacteria bacterium]|nr:hypothetical protein [Candidatus Poribacteria bacterium]
MNLSKGYNNSHNRLHLQLFWVGVTELAIREQPVCVEVLFLFVLAIDDASRLGTDTSPLEILAAAFLVAKVSLKCNES